MTPITVPAVPRAAPQMKKMRSTAPSLSPMVRRMPMSRPLFFTSMIRPETMFIDATSTRIDRMMNMMKA